MAFPKGKKRPEGAGRKKGTPNKSTTEVGLFFRTILDSPDWQKKVQDYFATATIPHMPRHILELAYHYGFGRPTEKLELTGANGGPIHVAAIQEAAAAFDSQLARVFERGATQTVSRITH